MDAHTVSKLYSYCVRIAPDAQPLFEIALCDGPSSAIGRAQTLLDTVAGARSVEVADGEGWRLVCDRPANDSEPWRDGLWA